MAYKFPSEEWIKALKEKINRDEKYAKVAKNWEGSIVFFIEKGGPIDEPKIFYLDLWHGECRDAFMVADEAQLAKLKPAFVLRSSYQNFVRIIKGQLDPMQAMITRKLKVKGNMGYMMRNVPTVLEFVRCAKEVDTEYL